MRLLVCGDRCWENFSVIKRRLNEWLSRRRSQGDKELVVIQGGAAGADGMAKRWAEDREALGVTCITFEAEWNRFGKRAGPIRNQKQLEEGKPDLVYAFHNHITSSKGTKDMVNRAIAAGIKVFLFDDNELAVQLSGPVE